MHEAVTRIAAAATLLWLGMVLGISFLEAPLKFRAPGVDLRVGLSVGRVVFRALNLVELGWLIVIALCLLADTGIANAPALPLAIWIAAAVVAVILLVQLEVVRPQLNRRTDEFLAGIAGIEETRSQEHRRYIVLEVLKVIALAVLAGLLLTV
ncbi:hypothetical protein [Skermania piniformis]|uniref:DUF4149 domain-containing protein n=1 Tax=Skermania pinensis TaxID=39122 RepID=A0ABX8SB90_9ACTN|nr:hypothetical protein [Skermania piniformis]QXQ15129.1 hypothetical protein KV203_07235 [Skermania piniformis]